MDRSDVDVMVGYSFYRWLVAMWVTNTLKRHYRNIESTIKLKEPVFGITANYPKYKYVLPFLSLGVYFLNRNEKSEKGSSVSILKEEDELLIGPAAELGIAAKPAKKVLLIARL